MSICPSRVIESAVAIPGTLLPCTQHKMSVLQLALISIELRSGGSFRSGIGLFSCMLSSVDCSVFYL